MTDVIQIMRERQIWQAAQQAGWSVANNGYQGVEYPIYSLDMEEIGRRFKAIPFIKGKPKYLWLGDKRTAYYYPKPSEFKPVEGLAYLASGEPDTLAFASAGIFNVLCWLNGETSPPDSFVTDMRKQGVTKLHTFPDLDKTGQETFLKKLIELTHNKIEVKAFKLPARLGEHGDINTLWIECQGDEAKFRKELAACEPIDLSMFIPVKARLLEPRPEAKLNPDFLRAIESALGIEAYKTNGYSRKNVTCRFHDDNHASASWHRDGYLKCFTCGQTFLANEVAATLAIQPNSFFNQRDKPVKPVVRKSQTTERVETPAIATPQQALLGACISNPASLLYIVNRIELWQFSDTVSRAVYSAILRLNKRNATITLTVLYDEMEQGYCPDKAYFSFLIENASNANNLDIHITSLREAGKRTRVERLLKIKTAMPIDKLIAKISSDILDIAKPPKELRRNSIADTADQYIDRLLAVQSGDASPGITTGLKYFDNVCGRLHPGNMLVVASRPGGGKTALLLNHALAMARQGKQVAIFSLEMDRNAITNRFLGMLTGYNTQLIRGYQIPEQGLKRLKKAATELKALNILINDDPTITPSKIVNWMKQQNRELAVVGKQPIEVFYIDYLQRGVSDNPNQVTHERVKGLTEKYKNIGSPNSLNAICVLAAQLRRECDPRAPSMSDIGSGAIEVTPDVILIVHYAEETDKIIELFNVKNRDGVSNTRARANYRKKCQLIVDLQEINLADLS